jgi:hypothetical protein
MWRVLLFGLLAAAAPAASAQTGCTGDLNADGTINLNDLMALLSVYGSSCPAPAAPPVVRFSEINYNPSATQGNDSDWEFVELHNLESYAVNLGGWRLTDGLTGTFPEGFVLAPQGFAVACMRSDSMSTVLPAGIPLFQWPSSASLNNSGEIIRLLRPDGTESDLVPFEDNDGWMTAPDGGGPSLEWMDIGLDNDYASSWAASFTFGGTPGAPNSMWGLSDPE